MAAKRKYGKKAAQRVERAMHERKAGTLRSGRSGKKVTSKRQAVAIGLSEAREAGGKVPKKATGKKTAKQAKKAAPKRSTAKKSTAKRSTAKKRAKRRTTTKRSGG